MSSGDPIFDGPFARTMPIASIPEKLRCGTCDKLAVSAFKLPCCDTTICDRCHEDLVATECPVCTHSPFSAEMVSPTKVMRTTIKVFIKSQAKKRGVDPITGKELGPEKPAPVMKDIPAIVPEPTDTPRDMENNSTAAGVEQTTETASAAEQSLVANNMTASLAEDGLQLKDVVGKTTGDNDNDEEEEEEDDDDDDDDDDVVITTERPEHEDQSQHTTGDEVAYPKQPNRLGEASEEGMQQDHSQDFASDQNMNGFGNGNSNFAQMNMNMGGFNPMMAMPGFMGMPNMLGMPGMGMDPSMMFNGNFGGGMGDMSMMGMGMGGMGSSSMANMGDFGGMGGPGFFPNQGNYMQNSNFGNAHGQNSFNHRGGYGRRFHRGRDNSYRGRGGWANQQHHQYGQNNHYGQNSQFSQYHGGQQTGANTAEVPERRGSPDYGTSKERYAEEPEANNTQELDLDTDHAGGDTDLAGDNTGRVENTKPGQAEQGQSSENLVGEPYGADGNLQHDPYNEFNEDVQYSQQSNNFAGHGDIPSRGGFGFGRGTDSTDLTPTPAPPINAPIGPKAMLLGLRNTGRYQPKPAPAPVSEIRAPSRSGEPLKDDTRQAYDSHGDRGRSRSHSQARNRGSKDQGRGADDDYDYESDATYARRKERERQKRKEREGRHNGDRTSSREAARSNRKHRSRSESRTDDSLKRRHRGREDEYRPSRSHRDRSKDRHRRRHRSRSPAREESQDEHSRRKGKSHRERDDEHDDSKESRRSRKHSRREDDEYYEDDRKDRSHRSKHDRARPVIEPPSDELGFKIKGSRSLKVNQDKDMAPPRHASNLVETPVLATDPYAEERMRAQQDREAREAQRRKSTQGSSHLGKRGREEDVVGEVPRGPKGDRAVKPGRKQRRIQYRYEDEIEGEEDSSRWR